MSRQNCEGGSNLTVYGDANDSVTPETAGPPNLLAVLEGPPSILIGVQGLPVTVTGNPSFTSIERPAQAIHIKWGLL